MQNSNQVGGHDTESYKMGVSSLICFSLGFLDMEYLETTGLGQHLRTKWKVIFI